MEDGDIAKLKLDGATIYDASGAVVERPIHVSELSSDQVELGRFQHYMQKEIFEQPGALAATLEMVTGSSAIAPELFGTDAKQILQHIDSVSIIACGTSYHAGLTAKYWLEEIAGIRTSVEIASEFRYRKSVVDVEKSCRGHISVRRNSRHNRRSRTCKKARTKRYLGNL